MDSITSVEIVQSGQTEPLDIRVKDTLTEDLIDVYSTSTFRLIDISDDSASDSGSFGPAGSAKMSRISEGIYQYNFNSSTYTGEYLLSARCVLQNESIKYNTFVKSVSSRHFAYAAQLRQQVDKSEKSLRDEISNLDRSGSEPAVNFLYGYRDAFLIYCLERGLQYLNAISPYTQLTIDVFPFSQYGTILIDAATIAALEAQGIFAIDTDFNYSLGGNSLVIDHFTKLSSMVSQILGRFTKTAISWKQQYRSRGLVMYQFMPGGVRAMRQLNAMPSGWWSRVLSAVHQ